MCEEMLTSILLQYGLAGVVIYIFYKLISNELKELRNSINELNKTIYELVAQLKQIKGI